MDNFKIFTKDFTATGIDASIGFANPPYKNFLLHVKGQGAAATSWTVTVEGSFDKASWFSILQHVTGDGDNGTTSGGIGGGPIPYIRINVSALTLGSATSLRVSMSADN